MKNKLLGGVLALFLGAVGNQRPDVYSLSERKLEVVQILQIHIRIAHRYTNSFIFIQTYTYDRPWSEHTDLKLCRFTYSELKCRGSSGDEESCSYDD